MKTLICDESGQACNWSLTPGIERIVLSESVARGWDGQLVRVIVLGGEVRRPFPLPLAMAE